MPPHPSSRQRPLPKGTQVLTRAPLLGPTGEILRPAKSTGVVVHVPLDDLHAYRVQFADLEEGSYRRADLIPLSHAAAESFGAPVKRDFEPFVLFRGVIGSRAYGLAEEDSDTDRRGVYMPPASWHWSLQGVPETLDDAEQQDCIYELEHFLKLGLKANPSILECLYAHDVQVYHPLGLELLEMREAFLSLFIHQSFSGFALSQRKRFAKSLASDKTPHFKLAMHSLRVLQLGRDALCQGELTLDVGEMREAFLAVKHGRLAVAQIESWRERLQREFDGALLASPLPEFPDIERIQAFLLRARRAMVDF